MLKALMLKELRETGWIALVGLVVHLAFVASYAGYPILTFRLTADYLIPFIDGSFLVSFCCISICVAVALGLRQTIVETRRGTWLFLLHRPASMRQVIAAKLLVGMGLYLLCGLIAILSYTAWAAMPGKHASPFYSWMTTSTWEAWLLIAILYLATFLSGIRPARWFGTRLLPLAAGGLFAILLAFIFFWPIFGIAVFILIAACLIGLIEYTVRTRDFS